MADWLEMVCLGAKTGAGCGRRLVRLEGLWRGEEGRERAVGEGFWDMYMESLEVKTAGTRAHYLAAERTAGQTARANEQTVDACFLQRQRRFRPSLPSTLTHTTFRRSFNSSPFPSPLRHPRPCLSSAQQQYMYLYFLSSFRFYLWPISRCPCPIAARFPSCLCCIQLLQRVVRNPLMTHRRVILRITVPRCTMICSTCPQSPYTFP